MQAQIGFLKRLLIIHYYLPMLKHRLPQHAILAGLEIGCKEVDGGIISS